MRIRAILICMMIAATVSLAQVPCPTDSIGGGGSGIGAMDTLRLLQAPTRCTGCVTTHFASLEMPYAFNGFVYLFSPNVGDIFSIQVVTDCHLLLWDTCSTLPANAAQGQFVVKYAAFHDSQLYINAKIDDTVIVICKSTPNPQEELDSVILDLNTCNPPVSVADPIPKQRRYWEFDGTYWRPSEGLLPNRWYKVR